MATDVTPREFDGMTVKELQHYLRARNQKISGTKSELVLRAKGACVLRLGTPASIQASRPQVHKLIAPNGYSMPDPNTLLSGWTESFDFMPEFSEKEIYNYMVLSNRRTTDSKPIIAKRQLKAAIFYEDRHVHSLQLHPVCDQCDHLFVRCKVIPSLPSVDPKKTPDHDVWVTLSKVTGRVHSASCTCAAGAGEACNHVSALLHALADISLKRKDGLLSCTSTQCKWKIPRKRKLQPMKSDDLHLMACGKKSIFKSGNNIPEATIQHVSDRIPNSNMPSSKINVARFRCELIKNQSIQCGFTVNTTPATENSKIVPKEVPKLTAVDMCIPDFVNIKSQKSQSIFQEYFSSLQVTRDEAVIIERLTRKQHNSPQWTQARYERITSSQFGKVCVRQISSPDKLVCDLMGYRGGFNNRHTRWGLSHEAAARKMYVSKMSALHPQIKVSQCGLIVNPDHPYLATSPDGLVSCTDCTICNNQHGVLEIKCPSVFRDLTPEAAAGHSNFFCTLVDNTLKLKENHAYYFQVQGQMALSKRRWCDFVVWTLKGISIERIFFDEAKWEAMVKKLSDFYQKAIIPELFTKRVYRGVALY